MSDPSVETWRATLSQSTSAQLRQMTAQASELTRLLLETRQDLAASQADLTAMEAKYDEASNEARVMRKAAAEYLSALSKTEADLATARYQNRLLTAENQAALRRLNEKEGKS
jgi:peptidoglycan hydrolase CwlO-like protein